MTVTLQNRTGRQFIFHLEHAATCTDELCFCGRKVVGVQDRAKTGEKTVRALKRRVPDSVTLNAVRTEGDKVSGLPDGVLHVADVSNAIRARRIVWTKDAEGAVGHHHAAKLAHAARVAAKAKTDNDRTAQRAAAEDAAKASEQPEADAPPEHKDQETPSAEAPKAEG